MRHDVRASRAGGPKDLHSREALLSALINSPRDLIIFALDREYRYLAFNERHREEMREVWDAEIEVGDSLLACMTRPDLRALAQASVDRALAGEQFTETQHQPGAERHYELQWAPIRIDGRVVGVTTVVRDITPYVVTLRALEHREQQQTAIAELGRLALTQVDEHALFDETVRTVARGLGVPLCKVLELQPDGATLRLVAGVGWDDSLVGVATVPATPESQAGFTLASRSPVVVDDLGTETRFAGPPLLHAHHVVSGVSVVVGPPDAPWGVLGAHARQHRTFTDDDVAFCRAAANVLAEAIARRRIERVLSDERVLYRDLVDSQPAGVYRLRVRRGEPWRDDTWRPGLPTRYVVEMVSARFCEISGVSSGDFMHDPGTIPDHVHPDDRDGFARENVRALTELVPFTWEGRMVRADGTVWVRFESIPRPLPDGDLIWTGLLYDITTRKEAEAKLIAQLEELRRWKSATVGREHRVIELKQEVNRLLQRLGLPARYPSVMPAPGPHQGVRP